MLPLYSESIGCTRSLDKDMHGKGYQPQIVCLRREIKQLCSFDSTWKANPGAAVGRSSAAKGHNPAPLGKSSNINYN